MSLATLKTKVEQLIEKAQNGGAQGIILSGFTTGYHQPTIADISGLVINDSANQFNLKLLSGLFANENGNANGGYYVRLKEVYLPQNLVYIYSSMFSYCGDLTTLHGDLTKVKHIQAYAFRNCKKFVDFPQLPSLKQIDNQSFVGCTGLTEVKFYSVLDSIVNNSFNGCTNLTDIYVPWAEGEVANAPWGATNATIHYNYTAEV